MRITSITSRMSENVPPPAEEDDSSLLDLEDPSDKPKAQDEGVKTLIRKIIDAMKVVLSLGLGLAIAPLPGNITSVIPMLPILGPIFHLGTGKYQLLILGASALFDTRMLFGMLAVASFVQTSQIFRLGGLLNIALGSLQGCISVGLFIKSLTDGVQTIPLAGERELKK